MKKKQDRLVSRPIKISEFLHKKLSRYKAYRKESFSSVAERIIKEIEKHNTPNEIKYLNLEGYSDEIKAAPPKMAKKRQRKQKEVTGGTGEVEIST